MNRLMPWAGWIGGLLGWFLSDQGGAGLVQWDCTRALLPVMFGIGAAGALVALTGGMVSLRAWRRLAGALDQPYAGARRFLAGTGVLAAGLFLLTILFQTMSSAIIPPCHA